MYVANSASDITRVAHNAQRDFMVVPSDLPGMDFVTMSVVHGHYVGRLGSLWGIRNWTVF